jgi:hypothetical protein
MLPPFSPTRREAVRVERLRDAAAFADRLACAREPLAQMRMQELRAHVERSHERRAAFQEHSDRPVEAGELVDLEPLADRRDPPERVANPGAHGIKP